MNKPPIGAFGFIVNFSDNEDSATSYFQEVTGLSIRIDTDDLQEGGFNNITHKIIKYASYGDVTLKRGLTDTRFYNWINEFINGTFSRKDITITVINDNNEPELTYKLLNTIPKQWNGPNLNVMQDAIATESIVLAVEGIVVIK